MPKGELLTSEIRGKLAGLKRAIRGRLAGEGLAWMVLVLVGAVFASLGLDYLLHLDRLQRGAVTALGAVAVGWVLWRRLMAPLGVPLRPGDLALLVEDRFGQLNDRLISAIEFSRTPDPGASLAMIAILARQANEYAAPLDFAGVVDRRGLWRAARPALCAAAILAGFAVWQGDVMRLWAARNLAFADVPWPQETYLRVEGGPDFTVLRGENLTVTVRLEPGSVPPLNVVLHARYPSGLSAENVAPSPNGEGTYVKIFPAVSDPFEFYVTGGDDQRDKRRPHRVRLIDPPAVREAAFTLEYPAYTRRPPRPADASGGVLGAPVGSRASVLIRANKDLVSASLVLGDKEERTVYPMRQAPDGGPKCWTGQFGMPTENRPATKTLRFDLKDTRGYSSRRGARFLVQIQADAAPSVEIKKKGVGAVVTPDAVIPLAIHARDDYGLAAMRAVLRAGEKPLGGARGVPDVPVGRKDVRMRHETDLRGRSLTPGDVVRVSVEADDAMPSDFGGPNTGVSGLLEFRVVKPEELMAELVRRQKALRLEFVQAIAFQESARAKTASAAEALQGGQITSEIRRRMSTSAGLQSNVAAECARAAETLQGILMEMINNRLGSARDHEQLRDGIIKPLVELAAPTARLVATMNATAALQDPTALRAQALRIADIQTDIRKQMEAILERMQKLQSRQELANQLQVIIKWSETLLKGIEKKRDVEHGKVFEPETQPAVPETQPADDEE